MPVREQRARQLLDEARQDLAAAARLAEAHDVGDGVVGFHLQQATEKLLKAALAARGADYAKTHDIGQLLAELQRHDAAPPGSLRELQRLTPYAVEWRYEDGGRREALDRRAVLQRVEELRRWVEAELTAKR